MRARSTVGVDDPLREEVGDGVVALRNIGGEDVVESAVFSDENDDMLDGRTRLSFFLGLD
jgi:hypothetical protein